MMLQIEGVAHVIKQLTDLQQTPNLDSPHYIVLKKTKEYEVRQYSPYLVAETSMPTGARQVQHPVRGVSVARQKTQMPRSYVQDA